MPDAEFDVRVLDGPLDPVAAMAAFTARNADSGGVASFVGQVRGEGGVELLELSHYAPLTGPGMIELARDAAARFGCDDIAVLHRVGRLRPGEAIVFVAAAARHRRGALLAVDYLMDHLKSAAWFWKRERTPAGWCWIEPREQDHEDRDRWAV